MCKNDFYAISQVNSEPEIQVFLSPSLTRPEPETQIRSGPIPQKSDPVPALHPTAEQTTPLNRDQLLKLAGIN